MRQRHKAEVGAELGGFERENLLKGGSSEGKTTWFKQAENARGKWGFEGEIRNQEQEFKYCEVEGLGCLLSLRGGWGAHH